MPLPSPLAPAPATTLQLLLAVVAAVIAVMLFAPALRYVQAYWLQVRCGLDEASLTTCCVWVGPACSSPAIINLFSPPQMSPPEWAADYIQTPVLPTAGLALHLLLPALTSLLWVRPMSQELLGLSDAALARTQAVALLATAAAMAANLRTLLQRYLDRGLTGGRARQVWGPATSPGAPPHFAACCRPEAWLRPPSLQAGTSSSTAAARHAATATRSARWAR